MARGCNIARQLARWQYFKRYRDRYHYQERILRLQQFFSDEQHLESPTPGQEQTISYILLVCTGMYWYVGVQHFTVWYVPVYTGMYQTAIIRTSYILVYTVSKSWWFFTLGASILGRYAEVYTSHVQHNTSWCFKRKIIHFLASSVRRMYIQVKEIEELFCKACRLRSDSHLWKDGACYAFNFFWNIVFVSHFYF